MPLPPSASNPTTGSVISLKKQFASLLGATLETWIHEILHVRRVYPSETFGSTRFLGVRCHVQRHPDVVSYIHDAIKTALPAILSQVADEIAMVIVKKDSDDDDDDGNDKNDDDIVIDSYPVELERYTIQLSDMAREWNEQEQVAVEVMRLLEQSMRDLILKVIGIDSGRACTSDSVSFKITLHIPEENKSCAELNQAFANGTWHDANSGVLDPVENMKGRVVRPLYQSTNPACTIRLMRLAKSERCKRKDKKASETEEQTV